MSTHYIEEAERLADDVAVMSHGRVIARGTPTDLLDEHAGRECDRVLRQPRSGCSRSSGSPHAAGLPTRRTGPAVSVLRAEDDAADELADKLRRRRAPRRPTSRTSSCCSPGRRSSDRHPHLHGAADDPRCGGSSRRPCPGSGRARRRSSGATGGRRRSPRWSSRRSTCWRSASASARWCRVVGGYPYIEFLGTGVVATAVLFSLARSPGCSSRSSAGSTRRPTTRSSPHRSTCTSSSPPRRPGSRTKSGVYGCAPLLVAIAFGLDPSWGMLLVPLIGVPDRARVRAVRHLDVRGRARRSTRSTTSSPGCSPRCSWSRARSSRSRGCPTGRRPWRSSTRSTTASSWCGTPSFGLQPLADLYHVGCARGVRCADGLPGRAQDAVPADRLMPAQSYAGGSG